MAKDPTLSMWVFGLNNARDLASRVTALVNKKTLDESIQQAYFEQLDPTANPVLYFPTRSAPTLFIELLQDPKKYDVYGGEKSQGVYGSLENALDGRTTEKDNIHKYFLVYDPAHRIFLDMIDREGKSMWNTEIRDQYLHFMSQGLGCQLEPYRMPQAPVEELE